MSVPSPKPQRPVVSATTRARGSLLQLPWLLAAAVVRMMSRQLDEHRVRKLTSGTHLR